MLLFQNKLAIASLVLGILAMVCVELFGPVIAFSYLGIPAIVTGAILLSRIKNQRFDGRVVAMVEAIIGIILGVLPLAFTLLVI